MNQESARPAWFDQLCAALRIAFATMTVCSLLYPFLVLGVARLLTPHSAEGSLIVGPKGGIVGSELLAQGFSKPEYFWPRPSAVHYNAAAAGGSNLSPANPRLRARAVAIAAQLGASADNPLPADLATASGSGLDPHITLQAALYQVPRVARARGLSTAAVMELLERRAERGGCGLGPPPLVNVVLTNLALDNLGTK